MSCRPTIIKFGKQWELAAQTNKKIIKIYVYFTDKKHYKRNCN